MATSLSNLCISFPVSTDVRRSSLTSKPSPSLKFQSLVRRYGNGLKITADARDNLDHLQKTNKQQQHPKNRTPSPIAIELLDRFPTSRSVQEMLETMDMLMEDPTLVYNNGRSAVPRDNMENGGYRKRGRTPWEIREGQDVYMMRFDMPGMTKNDVKVWVEKNLLVVKAEKEAKKKEGGEGEEGGVWSASSYGRYSSRIALPENVSFDKITAEVKDGVLYVSIPKASPTSKTLDIQVQ